MLPALPVDYQHGRHRASDALAVGAKYRVTLKAAQGGISEAVAEIGISHLGR